MEMVFPRRNNFKMGTPVSSHLTGKRLTHFADGGVTLLSEAEREFSIADSTVLKECPGPTGPEGKWKTRNYEKRNEVSTENLQNVKL